MSVTPSNSDPVPLRLSNYCVTAAAGDEVGVFSGMSGALEIIERQTWDQVQAFVSGSGSGEGIGELLEKLVRSRVICSVDHDEIGELRRRYDETRWRSDKLGFTVVTSMGCNFDCPYCFESKKPSLLKREVADAMVDILHDSLDTIRRMSVTWFGGEPLLGRRQLMDLSDRFIAVCQEHDKEYQANIITNGWHLNRDVAHELVARRVTSAQVTIDGPPDIHNLNRPLLNGGPTFERILANVSESADIIDIAIRVNLDATNAHRADELLTLMAEAGLSGRVRLGLGKITDAVSDETAPLATYNTSACMSNKEFSEYEMAFNQLAESLGFGGPTLPSAVGSPCTAVRSREVVVGADGELWKCWDDVGNQDQAIGSIFNYTVTNEKLDKYLDYHPADDPHCSTCIAMPVCMGGCAHHDFNSDDREARCGTFRHNHVERVKNVMRHATGDKPIVLPELPRYDGGVRTSATPVVLRSKPVRTPA